MRLRWFGWTALMLLGAAACARTVHVVADGTLRGSTGQAVQSARDPSSFAHNNDTDGVIYLDQGWSDAVRDQWMTTSQGSRMIPYDWYLVLQDADGSGPFHSVETYLRYRFLPRVKSAGNPDGLPVGFVRDPGSEQRKCQPERTLDPTGRSLEVPYIGLNCAACHTAQYNGTDRTKARFGVRVDGAGSLADFDSFLVALDRAMAATFEDPARWQAFRDALAAGGKAPPDDATLRRQFQEVMTTRRGFVERTSPTVKAGFGRLDAFTGIMNQLCEFNLDQRGNRAPLMSPVSYPHVWDAPWYDWVEWNGVNSGNGLGPLGRNVGEVLGTFASINAVTVDVNGIIGPGYPSTVRFRGMERIEKALTALRAPPWPEEAWGAIDAARAARGKAHYDALCLECHAVVEPSTHRQIAPPLPDDGRPKSLSIQAIMVDADVVGTDLAYADNISERECATGFLEGQLVQALGEGRQHFGPRTTGVEILKHFVASAISEHLGTFLEQSLESLADGRGTQTDPPPKAWYDGRVPTNVYRAYRARALNGIWATAPYLHNGSVLTLDDLLRPSAQRPKVIHTGSFLFDPVGVGLQDVNVCPTSWRVPGSAWAAGEDLDFGGDAETARVRQQRPDLSLCEALGYEIRVDPADPANLGNSAAGHEYGTDLDPAARADLVEYLKTL